MQLSSLPFLWAEERRLDNPSTIFSRRTCRKLRGYRQRLAHRDRELLMRLSDRRIRGVRSWEYGTLLAVLSDREARPHRALDVGSGGSTFPHYLFRLRLVGEMTTLDLAEAYELPPSRPHEGGQVERVQGSMLRLPFDRASFDLVTCISAIEHLDGDPRAHRRDPGANPQLPYDAYVDRTRAAIREMARVLAPGGLLYVTTDAYLPDRQFEDAWSPPNGVPRLWSAYRWEDIEGVFLDEALGQGLRLVGEPDYGSSLLLGDRSRSTYRGRFFSTFALLAERPSVRAAPGA